MYQFNVNKTQCMLIKSLFYCSYSFPERARQRSPNEFWMGMRKSQGKVQWFNDGYIAAHPVLLAFSSFFLFSLAFGYLSRMLFNCSHALIINGLYGRGVFLIIGRTNGDLMQGLLWVVLSYRRPFIIFNRFFGALDMRGPFIE